LVSSRNQPVRLSSLYICLVFTCLSVCSLVSSLSVSSVPEKTGLSACLANLNSTSHPCSLFVFLSFSGCMFVCGPIFKWAAYLSFCLVPFLCQPVDYCSRLACLTSSDSLLDCFPTVPSCLSQFGPCLSTVCLLNSLSTYLSIRLPVSTVCFVYPDVRSGRLPLCRLTSLLAGMQACISACHSVWLTAD